ncbi:hypothetical protein CEXT_315181 [Caerostris extrusa]|uniref:Uncharacterized protein n=1 Tax=Caerostris extrusa TaxID=172846 RepID=A0AAV4M9Q1_CAEEX|nr:hypothetical protein CEXT_315181 [Caerostris extrusa]
MFFIVGVSSYLEDDIPALHKLSHLLAIHHTGMTSRHAAKALHCWSAAEISGRKIGIVFVYSCQQCVDFPKASLKQKNK